MLDDTLKIFAFDSYLLERLLLLLFLEMLFFVNLVSIKLWKNSLKPLSGVPPHSEACAVGAADLNSVAG